MKNIVQLTECEGKPPFDSYSLAASTLSHKLKKVAKVYHCRVCHKWHVGGVQNSRRKILAIKREKERHA